MARRPMKPTYLLLTGRIDRVELSSIVVATLCRMALGQQLKVSQTPTFFINGIKVDGAWAPQFFDQAIAYELQHAK